MQLNRQLILSHPRAFIDGFSLHHDVPAFLLEKYEDVWNWKLLSKNTFLRWSKDLISHFVENWNWHYLGLSNNESLPWSADLLQHFESRWSWYHLGWQSKIVNDEAMFYLCRARWSEWDQEHLLSGYQFMPALKADAAWITDAFESWTGLNWSRLSAFHGFPWSEAFIAKHADKLDWEELSQNKGVPWNEQLIRRHLHRLNWRDLSYTVQWDAQLLHTFRDHIKWFSFSLNSYRRWNEEILIQFKDQIQWVWTESDEGGYIRELNGIYNHSSVQWTPALFAQCNEAIALQFHNLAQEEKDILEKSEFVVLKPDECWTIYLDCSNWNGPFAELMLNMEARSDGKKYLDWDEFAFGFNGWHLLSEAQIAFCLMHIKPIQLAANVHFPWQQFLHLFDDWQHLDHAEVQFSVWRTLSANVSLPLTQSLIEKYIQRWDWASLSMNPSLTIELILQFEKHWHWDVLFKNDKVATDLLELYPGFWSDWWRERKHPPFQNESLFFRLAGISPEASSADVDVQLEEVLDTITNQPEEAYRENFERALNNGHFDELIPGITHDRYLPYLTTFQTEILARSWPISLVETLSKKGYKLLLKKDFVNAIHVFNLVLNIKLSSGKIYDLTPYCNALYSVQSSNNGLPVDPALNQRFLDKCLPFAPRNPAIYYNAACLYVEMNDLDKAYECVALAKQHNYTGYDAMLREMKESAIFTDFVKDPRWLQVYGNPAARD